MNTRCCLECGKGVKSFSGLSHYIYRYPIVIGKKINVTRNISAETPPYLSQSYGYEQRDSDWISLNEVTTQTDRIDDDEWIDLDEDSTSSPKSICGNQSRLSTTASIRIDSYEEVTGKKAGQIFDDSDIPSRDGRSQSSKRSPEHSSRYHPFKSETDFALAQWFLSAKCTKGDIEKFYEDKRLGQIHQLLSFSSYNELMSKIHDIPYGIPDDVWKISEIEVEQETIGLTPSTYQIRYRNVKSVLEFLLGHGPFERHLSYAPVRQFSGAGIDNWIYDKMHTTNW